MGATGGFSMKQKASGDWMDIARYFYWDDEHLQRYANIFRMQLETVERGGLSSLSSLHSYMPLPGGDEKGTYLALDFGGTNVRASRIRLLGGHCFIIDKMVARPLRRPGVYDYTTTETTQEELFDFLADCIGEAAGGNKAYALGHTFSFSVLQSDCHDAKLQSWSKEIAVSGVEGEHINALLNAALVRRGLDKIRPLALINDTTAALLAAAYQYGTARIGVICGTGFNICFYEPALGMIINLEAGNYDGVRRSRWDEIVDTASLRPGHHMLEKMLSGAYLGSIYREVLKTYFDTDQIPPCSTKEMNSIVMAGNPDDARIRLSRLLGRIVKAADVEPLRNLAGTILVRTAQLSGASCYGILKHLYPQGPIPRQTIAVEGSVLSHIRGGLLMFDDALYGCAAEDGRPRQQGIPVEAALIYDGPSVGAAIAAAVAEKKYAD